MRNTRALLALGAAGALIVAACGSSKSGGGGAATTVAAVTTTNSASSGATTTAAGGATGGATTTAAPQQADSSKPPVLVGFHNLEGGAVVSLPEIRQAFESGVKYVNEELGGINGRPMKAETCNLDVTPESSVNCANQFVEKNVVVAVQGVDVAADAALPIWKQAGLVDIAFAGFTPGLNQSRGAAFVTLFDSRDILAQNLIMQQKLGAKNVAEVQEDLASTKAYYSTVEKPTADKLGLGLQPFYYSATTDWATLAATILSTNPDGIDFPAAQDSVCLAAIPALRSAGFTKTIHASSCAEYVDKLPVDQVDGIINHNEFYYPTMTNIPPKAQHDIDIFQKYMKRDVPGLKSLVYGELGFHIAVQAADMLRQVKGDITPQSVRDTMPTTKGPMFFRETGYDCSKNFWPPDSAACSGEVIYTKANKDRKKDVLPINPIDVSPVRPTG
ncbi:MAG: branched-chain amino acid transport system substrate-binding protein [Acidimicrobiaceae bacterium]|jgi:branched-chain amino acid transport system substrate-binding protein|nr:branched-chain amino acid transport system substrate-binding protein [Acidimicrobiaceae bacterium]